MSSELKSRLFVVLGSGGVGKTTSSAALALSLAKQGLRTVVITVDPAHRLAQVLGLDSLSNEPKEVERFDNGGRLSALWLDTSTALPDLVRKYGAGKIPSIEKVLNHRLFQILQSQLGGVEEYLGVEKVLSLGKSGDFDVCILDTPPSRHALDFLESPRHILRFFDEGVLKVFMSPDGEEPKKSGFFSKVFKSGKDQVLDVFKNFLGHTFLGELADLLQNLRPIHEAFTEVANDIEEWVRRPNTRFVMVSLLEPYPLDEARLLTIELSARELRAPSLMLLNKCLPRSKPPESALKEALGDEAAQHLEGIRTVQEALRQKLSQN